MLRRKLNLFDRIEGLNEGLGVEVKIWRNPLVLKFKPRKDPLSKILIDAPLPNEVVFEVLSKDQVAVSYLEIFPLDIEGEIPSVRIRCEIIRFSYFRKIMSIYKLMSKAKMKR